MQELTTVIGTIGFPIVACVGLGYFINNTIKSQREDNSNREEKQREDNSKREDKLFSQIDKIGGVLDKFNATLEGMDSRLKSIEKSIENNIVEGVK